MVDPNTYGLEDMDMDAREMYKEHILELYKHPHNFGELKGCTHEHRELNPLCGDDITIQLIVENDVVTDVKFSGKGCAICMASASLVTDKIKGMNIEKIRALTPEDVYELLMIPISQVRLKCALLSLEVVHKTIP